MFHQLAAINARPALYSRHTTAELWTDPHISAHMLGFHLDGQVDIASYHEEFIDRSVRWVTRRFGLGFGQRVADFGCGPGLYCNRLARTGAAVTGIDFSEVSIRHAAAAARREGLPVTYRHQDYLSYAGEEPFDLVVMIMRDYCALPPGDRRRLLHTVRNNLAGHGAFLFDVDSVAAFAAVREEASYARSLMDGFWSSHPYFGFRNVFRYEDERVSLEKYEIVEADGRRTYCNWVQHFDPDSLAAELRAGGFRLDELLGDVAGGPYRAEASQFAAVAVGDSSLPGRCTTLGGCD